MQICSIITSFTSGGAETLVCNMAAEFRSAGHEATVVSLCDAAEVGNSADTEARMMERVRGVGAVPRSLKLGSRRGLLSGARALRRLLQEVRPDLVHAHTARAVLMLKLAGVRAPVVLTHHNSRLSFPPRLFGAFDTVVSAYVAISGECAEIARRHARRPVEQIVNGADSSFRAAAPRSEPAQHPVIVAVGTASAQKDYPTLIRAARPLAERLGDRKPKIRIVGGGAILPELQALIDAEGVGDLVELTGPRHDVPELLREAALFANSSHYEGMSVAMLEALSAALPIVATKVPGNVELVEDRVNGLLVPPESPDALADGIAELLTNNALYASCSAASLAMSGPYTLEGCAEAHMALYDRVLGNAAARRAA
jgi:glycosyltransferase involved in cell wall biosynthesis